MAISKRKPISMEPQKVIHFLYCPFVGLGLYGGYRGKRWLRNRIKIFKQFVVPSLQAQTNKDFILWVSWRHEERTNPLVLELKQYLDPLFKTVFTYDGVCFWDDKYPDAEARTRLVNAVHGSLGELLNVMGEGDTVLMTIQPSDDCYHRETVEQIQKLFKDYKDVQAAGFTKGYVMDYTKGKIAEWNPTTHPPFFTIKFPRDTFSVALAHVDYTGPYKSHEYIGDKLKFAEIQDRGFLVGTHGENISTIFNHPFTGKVFDEVETQKIRNLFGLSESGILKIPISIRKKIMRHFSHRVQRKVRYVFGEKFYSRIYNFLRS